MLLKKQTVWLLTMLSLVVVLSVYYITSPEQKSNELAAVKQGEKEVPIVVEYQKPAIRGVLVVAKGAENIQVKKWIIEAVTRSLDVPSHRVAVMPKK